MSEPESKSEIAQLLRRIDLEYQAAQWGLTGFAEGSSKHAFITARRNEARSAFSGSSTRASIQRLLRS